jgi:DUF917 family protein
MRLSLIITALICIVSNAHAHGQGKSDISIGEAIICDTSEQAQRYVTLRHGGSKAMAALQVVNTEANKASACGAATVAFRRGETIGSERIDGERVEVVKITVLAFANKDGWVMMADTEQYAIIAPPGIET